MNAKIFILVFLVFGFLVSEGEAKTYYYDEEYIPYYNYFGEDNNTNNTDCGLLKDCGKCSEISSCLWCQMNGTCANMTYASMVVCPQTGWCNLDSCTCSMFPAANSIGSMVVMIIIYGIFLGYAAKMIADGSELLLEIFPNWGTIIGGLLLPILGALPDGAMILVSGAFGPRDEAQSQVSVGVGTLAGSTIMLLTIPWAISLFVARCDIYQGESIDKQLTKKGVSQLTETGITVDRDTVINARIAFGASFAFWIVQGVAFMYIHDPTGVTASMYEEYFSLAGFIFCSLGFVAYCAYQVIVPKLAEKRTKKAEEERSLRLAKLKALHVVTRMRKHAGLSLPIEEGHHPVTDEVKQEQQNANALAVGLMWKRKAAQMAQDGEKAPLMKTDKSINKSEHDDESESGEEKEEESFGKVLGQSLAFMLGGAALVAFFSDPMVDVISNFGNSIGMPPFYVSFLITPFCSNASELIASIVFAAKKTTNAASMTYSQLYGAATMNCTLGLGIFYALIYFRQLAWTFSAETMSILFVSWAVCGVGSVFPTLKLWFAFPNIALYPFSLLIVYCLENFAGWT